MNKETLNNLIVLIGSATYSGRGQLGSEDHFGCDFGQFMDSLAYLFPEHANTIEQLARPHLGLPEIK